MNTVRNSIFFLPLTGSVGGNVYVPPTVCLRSAYTAARAAAHVACTGRAKMDVFTGLWSASGLVPNSLISEVG
jgi:hypothetical protein